MALPPDALTSAGLMPGLGPVEFEHMAEVICWHPKEGKKIPLLLEHPCSPRLWHLVYTGLLPFPADVGVELLGDAEPRGGHRSKSKEQEKVKL